MPFVVMGTANSPGNHGYDGQFYYRMALSGLGAAGFDNAAYRWQRPGYPLAARLLALNRPAAIPAALVAVNVAAIAAGVFLISLLLDLDGAPVAYALMWALYAGQVAAFWRDLAEPLAMALVAGALLCQRRGRLPAMAVCLALAALTKETALLFTAAAAMHYLCRGRPASAALIAASALPYLLWQTVLLRVFGYAGLSQAQSRAAWLPGGLSGARGWPALVGDWVAVAGPSLVCALILALSLWAARNHGVRGLLADATSVASLALLANLAFVWLLPRQTYADLWASARTADGLVLAALTHPCFVRSRLRWLPIAAWACSAPLLWLPLV